MGRSVIAASASLFAAMRMWLYRSSIARLSLVKKIPSVS
jgi:hypothetical protein